MVQTQVSQQLLGGLPWSLAQQIHSAQSFSHNDMFCQQQVKRLHYTSWGPLPLFILKSGAITHVFLRMNYYDFSSCFNFRSDLQFPVLRRMAKETYKWLRAS